MLINGLQLSHGDLIVIIHVILPFPYISGIIGQSVNYFMGADEVYNRNYQILVDLCLHYEKNLKLLPILERRMKLADVVVRGFIYTMILLYHVPVLTAVITTIITGEKIYAFFFILPYIDELSTLGFCVNSLFHWICSIIAFMFYTAHSSGISFCVLQVKLRL